VNHIIDDICYFDEESILVYARYGELNTINLVAKDTGVKMLVKK